MLKEGRRYLGAKWPWLACPWSARGTAVKTQKEYIWGNSRAAAPTPQPGTLSGRCSALLSVGSRGSNAARNTALTVPGDTVTSAPCAVGSMLSGNGLPCSNLVLCRVQWWKHVWCDLLEPCPWQAAPQWSDNSSSALGPFAVDLFPQPTLNPGN